MSEEMQLALLKDRLGTILDTWNHHTVPFTLRCRRSPVFKLCRAITSCATNAVPCHCGERQSSLKGEPSALLLQI